MADNGYTAFGSGLEQGYGFVDSVLMRRRQLALQQSELALRQNADNRAQQEFELNKRQQNQAYLDSQLSQLSNEYMVAHKQYNGQIPAELEASFHNKISGLERSLGMPVSDQSDDRGAMIRANPKFASFLDQAGDQSAQDVVLQQAAKERAARDRAAPAAGAQVGPGLAQGSSALPPTRVQSSSGPTATGTTTTPSVRTNPNPLAGGAATGPAPTGPTKPPTIDTSAPAVSGTAPTKPGDAVAAAQAGAPIPGHVTGEDFWATHDASKNAPLLRDQIYDSVKSAASSVLNGLVHLRLTSFGATGPNSIYGMAKKAFDETNQKLDAEYKWSRVADLNDRGVGFSTREALKANPQAGMQSYLADRDKLPDRLRAHLDPKMVYLANQRINDLNSQLDKTSGPTVAAGLLKNELNQLLTFRSQADANYSASATVSADKGADLTHGEDLNRKLNTPTLTSGPTPVVPPSSKEKDIKTVTTYASKPPPGSTPPPAGQLPDGSPVNTPLQSLRAATATSRGMAVPDRNPDAPEPPMPVDPKVLDAATRLRRAGLMSNDAYEHYLATGSMLPDSLEKLKRIDVSQPYQVFDGDKYQLHMPSLQDRVAVADLGIKRAELGLRSEEMQMKREKLPYEIDTERARAANLRDRGDASLINAEARQTAAEKKNAADGEKELKDAAAGYAKMRGKGTNPQAFVSGFYGFLRSDPGIELARKKFGVEVIDPTTLQPNLGRLSPDQRRTLVSGFSKWYLGDQSMLGRLFNDRTTADGMASRLNRVIPDMPGVGGGGEAPSGGGNGRNMSREALRESLIGGHFQGVPAMSPAEADEWLQANAANLEQAGVR
jgi:hypothetical protein